MRSFSSSSAQPAPDKPGKLRSTLIGTALAGAVMLSGAGPVSAAVRAEPETGAPAAATAAQPTAMGTTTAATQAATRAATRSRWPPGSPDSTTSAPTPRHSSVA